MKTTLEGQEYKDQFNQDHYFYFRIDHFLLQG